MGIFFLVGGAGLALVVAFTLARERFRLCGMEACLGAATLLAAWTVVEFWALSWIGGVSGTGHAAATLVFTVGGALAAGGLRARRRLREGWRLARLLLGGGSRWEGRIAAWLAGAWLAWALLVLGVLPPIVGDAMVFHLPRVAHWIQNGHLFAHDTGIVRQISTPCNGEILVLAHCLPMGSDRLCEIPQWEALVVAWLAGLAIARLLGLRGRACAAVTLLNLSVPVVLVQSYQAKNDLVFGAFAALAGLWGLRSVQGNGRGAWTLFLLSLSLLVGTKVHGALLGLPMALLAMLRAPSRAAAIRHAALLVPVLFVLACPVYIRSWLRFGSPMFYMPGPMDVQAVPGWASWTGGFNWIVERLSWASLDYRDWGTFNHNQSHFGFPFWCLVSAALTLGLVRRLRGKAEGGRSCFPGTAAGGGLLVWPVVISVLFLASLIIPRWNAARLYLYAPLMLVPLLVRAVAPIGARLARAACVMLILFSAGTIGGALLRDSTILWRAPEGFARGGAFGVVLRCLKETLHRRGDFLSVTEFLSGREDPAEVFRELERSCRPGDVILLAFGEDSWEYPAHGKRFDRRVLHARRPGAVPVPASLGDARVWLLWDVRYDPVPRAWYEASYQARKITGTEMELWELSPRAGGRELEKQSW